MLDEEDILACLNFDLEDKKTHSLKKLEKTHFQKPLTSQEFDDLARWNKQM